MDPEEPEEPIAPNVGEGDAEDATTAPEDERVLVSEVTAVYSYLYASGKLLQEKVTTDGKTETHSFFYDNSGTPYAMQVDGTTYYYITNLQGDVVEMVDASGNTVASYTYSPYGKVLTAEGTLADKNPLRYRGYYYDAESGLYYLQSRYYDPGTGRFINADSYAGTGQGVLGYNMFAYCNGNPIMLLDKFGNKAVPLYRVGGGSRWEELVGLWKYRIDSANTNTKTQRHIHVVNGRTGDEYSQNEDGSPHDKGRGQGGKLPKKVQKALLKKGWDYNGKREDFFKSTEILARDDGIVYKYADGTQAVCTSAQINYDIAGAERAYYNSTSENTVVFIVPMVESSGFGFWPTWSMMPLPIPAF